ncbi:MAG: hypothetical protein CO135_01510 [Candidatus Levybacteria bacterium CG_4_9_14_3_um_filter_35_16]|nr:MAG: hypothetical protein COW87_02960 [Candidatus Levybacteria bacterium CG22_combo_CG10-13_8_21_14_all_35_11]PJA00511.1 MAG: hypothetical protein COX78_00430 [Candidatus Levybacteria bacterium CG_4_10_14_0_2_um_filter_35_8]PJA91376.1 MAG: hypothetical protein CO135_01510 [Candidatus Levybacteria bacterium CG_4_9_14_3_um_filter_35_16]PJC54150.1 MAG: hypothetical protein CO028_03925 [Candidatus Levybacteria bacterium CG_4_9_14_0_2_um_filter_35_21]
MGQKELATPNIATSAAETIGGKVNRSTRTVVTSKDDIVAELRRKPGFLNRINPWSEYVGYSLGNSKWAVVKHRQNEEVIAFKKIVIK